MQPRFPPPFGVPPGQPGFFPPQFPPPAGMPMFPPNMPGMPPGSLPPRMLHGMPPPPMFNPMMMPPRPMFPPGTVLPPQFGGLPPALMIPPASASVIVGAPVLNAPVPAALYPNPAAGSMAMFNAASSANKEANSTSNLLHKHIFTNAYAGLPVTLYIGKIPLDFEDAKLSRMLEACGKVTKYARPIDPTTQVPASIAFVIYAQAICGLRCLNILNQYEVGRENDVPQRLEVRTGTKETTIMLSVQLVEKEAELTLPEGASIDEIYNPIRETMTRILNPPVVTSSTAVVELTNKVPTTPSAVAALAAVKSVATGEPAVTSAAQSTEPAAPGDLTTRTGDSGNANYYAFIDDEEHDELGEKQLMSEIERFRMRQTQRDKEMEEQKRIKMKQRIRELYEAKKNEKIAAPVDHQAAIIAANNAAAADALLQGYLVKEDTNSKKRGNEEDAAELEAKKRRRLQVLQMLSEDIAVDLEAIKTAPTPAAPSAPAAPAPLKLVGLAKGKPAAGVSMGSKPGTFAAGIDGDEEDKPKREIVLLDYTADELQELESAYLQYQEEDDEEVAENGAVYKKKKKKSLADLLSSGEASALQARVLAQAQALSASLAQKVSSNIAAAANSNAANAGSGTADQKAELRQLLDKIPTERDELYAYKINWGALHRNNVIASTMHGWIVKKIVEYLGEEEESLTAFIVGKLNTGCRPSELVDELCMVLDEDAEQFVQKLWRMLIYYSLKNE